MIENVVLGKVVGADKISHDEDLVLREVSYNVWCFISCPLLRWPGRRPGFAWVLHKIESAVVRSKLFTKFVLTAGHTSLVHELVEQLELDDFLHREEGEDLVHGAVGFVESLCFLYFRFCCRAHCS